MRTGLHRQNLPLSIAVAAFITLIAALVFSSQLRKPGELARNKSLRAELIKSSQDQQLEQFNLTGFDEHGKRAWNLEGTAAKIDPGQTVFLDKNVTLKLKDATIIRTDHVQWSQDGGVLKTDSVVRVDHENAQITGIGARGKMQENFIQLNRRIDMLIKQTAADKPARLTCSGPLKIFFKENKMIFYRNVKIVDDRGTLTANRMDVFFDPDEKKVNQIVAMGDVIITRGTDTTRSQRAIYTVATGSIRLEGNPEITLHKESSAILDATLRN